ncbi:MAG: IS1595 family transposase [Chromatiales bacterium]|nr:IS1595 family transposase [Chromatiales bacterium]
MYNSRNKYYKFSKISEARFRRLIKAFAMDFTATDSAELTGLSIRSVNDIFLKIRRRIAAYCEEQSPYSGEIELDESYFSPRRVRGKRGRGAGSKTIVFGIFKRNGHVYTEIVPDARKKTLLPVIRGRVDLDAVIHTDGWRAYDGLVDLGYEKHFRVHHGVNEFVRDKKHINGIESFWAFAKHRLARFKGLPKHTFYLHLKETEFRFNHRNDDIYKLLLKMLRKHPI